MHTSSTGEGPGFRCSRGDPPRAKEAPGSCETAASGEPGGITGTGKHSSIMGLVQFRRLLSREDVHVCAVVPLPEPCTKVLLLLEGDHSSPSTRSLGACFTVVLWELPSWLKSMPESPRRRRTSDGEMGRWSSTRLLGLLVPSASSRCLQLPHTCPLQEYGLGAQTAAGRHAPAGPREGLCCPISCKHTAPSLSRESPRVYSGELAFFWLIMSKYKSERRKRG